MASPRPRITLLGGFAAESGGVAVPDSAWRLRKAKDLVKLLALADGRRLHREQAMDLLWPERRLESAANNLNQAVHAARKALGAQAIDLQDSVLRLEADLDVEAFESAAADARRDRTAASCERALALYGGELLPENRYDDWAELERGRLAGLRDEVEQILDELGVVPGRRRLPLETSTFVGREHELAELRMLLGRTRLLTLAGTGGAGKTRLALELARSREDAHADGAVLVELGPVGEGAQVPDAVAEALDLRALPGGAVVDALAAELAPRELLLVLDNCEHVIGPAAALADALLRSAPRLTMLATSREPLRVPGEVVFRVPSLAIPDPDGADPPERLLDYEAVRLFVDRAGSVAPSFALDETNAAAVARICHRLDGLPLALELAAARVDALAPDALAERLDDRFRLLRAGSRTAPTRQQTLEAALDWSYGLLADAERVLLRRLAVFAGGFTLEAVEAVCGGDGLDEAQVADLVARLVEKSLVAVEERRGARRYRLLETIHAYAELRLSEAGERAPAAARHAAWLAGLVDAGDAQLSGLETERGNLRAALETLLADDPAAALRLCARVWPFWVRRIELAEARRWLGEALERAPEPSPERARALLGHAAVEYRSGEGSLGVARADEALALARELGEADLEWRAIHFRGGIEIARDDGRAAASEYEAAVEVARGHELRALEAVSVYSLGVAAWVAGDIDAAEKGFAESDELFASLGDPDEMVPSLVNVAQIAVQDGPVHRLVFEDTLQPFSEVTCGIAAGYVVLNWANVARTAGDPARARELLAEALRRFERAGSVRGPADVWARLAYLALSEGDVEEAAQLFERVRELRAGLGDRRGAALALVGLGSTAVTAGDYARADVLLQEAVDTFRRAGDRWGLVSALWRSAELEQARGRLEQAEILLEQALAVIEQTPNRRWHAVTSANLAAVALAKRAQTGGKEALARTAPPAIHEKEETMTETLAPVLGEATVQELRETLRGPLFLPGDDGYLEAKQLWNGAHDGRMPAAVASCAGVADVIAALGFARAHDLTVAVRGGGHSVAGLSTVDGGMLIDLSPMRNVRVDPEARIAYVGPGAVWGDVDHEAQQFGLATTGGLVSTTGVAGFTLGGGIGWLMRQYGLACDNLVGADVVTADGRLVHASATENTELFWGLRGGGGNFGIVTSFELALHPVGPTVYAGPLFLPGDAADDLLRFYRGWAPSQPDAITTAISLATAPPLPVIPEEWHGKKVAIVIAVCAGPVENGEALVRELRGVAEPVADLIHPMPYRFIQGLLDPLWPKGINAYFKGTHLTGLSDETIDSFARLHQDTPGPQCEIHIHQMGGAVARVGAGETAYPERSMPYVVNVVTGTANPVELGANTEWARTVIASAKADETGRRYVNFLSEPADAEAAYGAETYRRLVALKDEYDPTNVFRLNQNIAPSA